MDATVHLRKFDLDPVVVDAHPSGEVRRRIEMIWKDPVPWGGLELYAFFTSVHGQGAVLLDLRQHALKQGGGRCLHLNTGGTSVRTTVTDLNFKNLELGTESDDEI